MKKLILPQCFVLCIFLKASYVWFEVLIFLRWLCWAVSQLTKIYIQACVLSNNHALLFFGLVVILGHGVNWSTLFHSIFAANKSSIALLQDCQLLLPSFGSTLIFYFNKTFLYILSRTLRQLLGVESNVVAIVLTKISSIRWFGLRQSWIRCKKNTTWR